MQSSSSTVELPRRITRKQKRLADKSLECLEADTRSTAHEEVCSAVLLRKISKLSNPHAYFCMPCASVLVLGIVVLCA